ncbi:NnrU protein [Rhodovarius crocodyli]|uniref:NnrU protein n=1 Tax=Rhodovarius crocodyli TaxID=1979269 RepID=A0A437MG99_9PROT|nr:NnrU family protein [Rhodovarius crocodyli]RVT96625.1 NnrU protein [Rhodovarius crocodyli]
MLPLILAAAAWLALHIGVSGTALRGRVVAALGGEWPFRGVFSAASTVVIIWLVMAWRAAPTTPLWYAPGALRGLVAALMLLAFVLFALSVAGNNPTSVGQSLGAEGARGITRVTRHPMLWSFAIWAGAHLLANGDTAALVFFGTFLVTALAGMPSIDAKLAKRDPAVWARLSAETSILPFGAVLAGRNRVSWAEIGWLRPAIGVLAWAAMAHLHGRLIGVPVW